MPSEIGQKAEEPFENLQKWMHGTNKGYKCRLISKEIPGAGRGLFAAEDIPAGETILEIPSSALLNPLSLASTSLIPDHLFPLSSKPPPAKKSRKSSSSSSTSVRLNTTQLLTLYLALARNPKSRNESPWKTYLATLPESFWPWHPLTWLYREGEEGRWKTLLELMPTSTSMMLDKVRERFEEDLGVLKAVLTEEPDFKDQSLYPDTISDDTLLWAWLNVNTRTVSIPLDIPGPSSLQNHTLVPILDMINHSSNPLEIIPTPIQFSAGPGLTRGKAPYLVPGKIGFRLISPERGLKRDEEIKFEYGPHSTETLFTEYGFFPLGKNGDWLAEVYGECDVNDIVAEMFPIRSEEVMETLKETGCWGENKIYTHPKPVHASHGLIKTLRSYHLNKVNSKDHQQTRQSLNTGGCEDQVRQSLIDLCSRLVDQSSYRTDECERYISGLHEEIGDQDQGNAVRDDREGGAQETQIEQQAVDKIYIDTVESILPLWYERIAIAGQLKAGLEDGQKIWD